MQIQMNIVMYASHLKKTGRMVSRFSCYLCAVSGGRPWRFLRAVKYQGSSRARKKPSLCRCCEWNKWKWMLHGSASACHDVLSLLFLPQQISFLDHFTLKPHFQNHCTWDTHKKKNQHPMVPWIPMAIHSTNKKSRGDHLDEGEDPPWRWSQKIQWENILQTSSIRWRCRIFSCDCKLWLRNLVSLRVLWHGE